MDSLFSVKEILRKPNIDSFDFFAVLEDNKHTKFIVKINADQKAEIARGLIFINETVNITKIYNNTVNLHLNTNDSRSHTKKKRNSINGSQINDEVVNICSEQNEDIIVNDFKENDNPLQNDEFDINKVLNEYYISDRIKYYPFLSDMPEIDDCVDILPYKGHNALSVAENSNRSLPVHGRVLYKSRIMTCKNEYPFFFFIVLKSGYRTLNAFFWDEKISYYNSIVCDDVLVLKNYKRKKKMVGEFNSINSFGEIFLLNGSYVDIIEKSEIYRDSEISKCNNILDSNYFKPPYVDIEGTLQVLSVIIRKRHKKESFTEIHDKICDFYYCLIDDKIVVLFNNSQPEFNNLKSGCFVEINNLWEVKRGETKYYTSSLFTYIKIITVKESMIDSVLCFLPDNYATHKDIFDPLYNHINGTELDLIPFKLFEYCSLHDLSKLAENLVIHEHRKMLIKGKLVRYKLDSLFPKESKLSYKSICDVDNYNHTLSMSYLDNDIEKSFQTDYIKVQDNHDIINLIIFKNFLVAESNEDILYRAFCVNNLSELEVNLGNEYVYAVDLFRNDFDHVLIYLTKCFKV